jgi:hypothetical protein
MTKDNKFTWKGGDREMKKILFPFLAFSLVLVTVLATFSTPAAAVSSTYDFPSDDSTVVGSMGFIDAIAVGYFWSADRGDLVSETFSTSLSTIDRARWNISVITNALVSGAFVNWDLEINSVVVGSFTINDGFTGPVTVDVSFPTITGPSYNVTLRVTNTVAGGDGSHSIAYAGPNEHSIELFSTGTGVDVDIDIKPGSFPNSINVKSKGLLPVAILGSADFDAEQVDPETVRLSWAGISGIPGVSPLRWNWEDVNDDGFLDLGLKYSMGDLMTVTITNEPPGSLMMTVMGNLKEEHSGTPIEGYDTVRIINKGYDGP